MRTFKRDPLKAVLADRGKYVAAILTIARAYIAADMPKKPDPFMSFKRWSDIVTGSLIWLGCADPCATVADLAAADPARDLRADVFRIMARELPQMAEAGMFVRTILRDAEANQTLRDALIRVASDKDRHLDAEKFGKWLRASANKIAGGYKLTADRSKQRNRW